MKTRVFVAVAVLAVTAMAIIAWISLLRLDPTVQGRRISGWISSLTNNYSGTTGFSQMEAENARWRALGPQAIPILVKAMEKQPGKLAKAYAKNWPKLPGFAHKVLPRPVDYAQIRWRACAVLADVGEGWDLPGPPLIRALKDEEWEVRMNALACLGNVVLPRSESGKDQFLPSLLLCATQDPQMQVRMSAVACLGDYASRADQVIPVLTKALADPNPDIRIRAARALHKVDPDVAVKAGVIEVAFGCLTSNTPFGASGLAQEFLQKLGKLPASEGR